MQPYQHSPLQSLHSTRILRLEPAKSLADPITCSLHEVSLDTNPGYAAISYSWGGQASDKEVSCSGTQLLVTANAAMVLRYVRQQRGPRWVWIDSICINQNDVQEKTGQVRLMREIYSKAAEVLLWLGESTKTSGTVFRSISDSARMEVRRRERPFDVTAAVVESDLFRDFLAMAVVKPLIAFAGMFSGNSAIKDVAHRSNCFNSIP
jgi:Heterokaryon incompatibility protein (HET)